MIHAKAVLCAHTGGPKHIEILYKFACKLKAGGRPLHRSIVLLFLFLLFISPYTTTSIKFRFPMSRNGHKRPFVFTFIVLYFITTYAVLFNCGGSFLNMIGKGTTNQKYDKYCVLLREIPLQTACRSRFAALRGTYMGQT